jgi:hypothetical protein
MVDGVAASESSEPEVLDRWSARKIRPIVVLYVMAVFAFFMAMAYFVFSSTEAVKALALAAVATIVATLPGIMERIEYRLTQIGVERKNKKNESPGCTVVFRWDELSRVVPMRHGFKYFKNINETSPLRRFWKVHLCDQYSGEVHVEKDDLGRVLQLVERQR